LGTRWLQNASTVSSNSATRVVFPVTPSRTRGGAGRILQGWEGAWIYGEWEDGDMGDLNPWEGSLQHCPSLDTPPPRAPDPSGEGSRGTAWAGCTRRHGNGGWASPAGSAAPTSGPADPGLVLGMNPNPNFANDGRKREKKKIKGIRIWYQILCFEKMAAG